MMNSLFKKLRNNHGESIAEILIAILVSVFGITLLAIMIQTSSKLILSSKKTIENYTEDENKIVLRSDPENSFQAKLVSGTNPIRLYKDSEHDYINVYVYKFEFGGKDIISFGKVE